jgi:hypothetical protein
MPGTYTVSFVEPGAPQGELRVRVREMDAAAGGSVDLTLDEEAPRGSVSGRAVLAPGIGPATGPVQVQLVPAERPRDRFGFVAATGAADDGSFTFGAVPPGRYAVRAACDADGAQRLGESPVEVSPGAPSSVEVLMH